MSFREIAPEQMNENLFALIGREWMLVAAGDESGYNMMTASWGSMGVMWGKPSVVTVVRPQRYTREFLDKQDYFTLSFYGDRKDIHKVCGSKSGRDVDKTAETGLHPVFSDGTVYFDEARLVLICKKQYRQQLDAECVIDDAVKSWYPESDYHFAYAGEVVKVLVKE